jgi:hypothetical protein
MFSRRAVAENGHGHGRQWIAFFGIHTSQEYVQLDFGADLFAPK